jgi:hypothetical protein
VAAVSAVTARAAVTARTERRSDAKRRDQAARQSGVVADAHYDATAGEQDTDNGISVSQRGRVRKRRRRDG